MTGHEESEDPTSPAKIACVRGRAKPSMWFGLVSDSGAETAGNEDDDLDVR